MSSDNLKGFIASITFYLHTFIIFFDDSIITDFIRNDIFIGYIASITFFWNIFIELKLCSGNITIDFLYAILFKISNIYISFISGITFNNKLRFNPLTSRNKF